MDPLATLIARAETLTVADVARAMGRPEDMHASAVHRAIQAAGIALGCVEREVLERVCQEKAQEGKTMDIKKYQRFVTRLGMLAEPFEMKLEWPMVMVLVGQLQLALRHPGNQGVTAKMARQFVDDVIHSVELIVPELGPYMRAGDDPKRDLPVERN